MPRLRWLSFHLALLASALLGAALVVAPALLAVLAMVPAADLDRAQRLLALQVGTWLTALLVARFYSRKTGCWGLARWHSPLPPVLARPLLAGHALLAVALWEGVRLRGGEGSGLLFLLALAGLGVCYVPVLSRIAEDGRG